MVHKQPKSGKNHAVVSVILTTWKYSLQHHPGAKSYIFRFGIRQSDFAE
jgi:hypothetical protein